MSFFKIKLQLFLLISTGFCLVFLAGSALGGKHDVAYLNGSNDAFVRSLYRSILDRHPDEGGVKNWRNWLERGKSRAWVITQFFNSREYLNLNKSNVNYVRDLYQGVLGRQPDSGGLNNWVNHLNRGRSRNTVLNDFLNSKEYRSIRSRSHASKTEHLRDERSFDQQKWREGGTFKLLVKYPQGNNLICDGPSKDVEYWFNAKLQTPITIETKKDPDWKPPYGGNIIPSKRTYSKVQYMGNGWYKIVRKNALSCYGYNKPGRKSFPIKCVATITDANHRKSWPVHYYTMCILK